MGLTEKESECEDKLGKMKVYHLIYSNGVESISGVYASHKEYSKEDLTFIVSSVIADGVAHNRGLGDIMDAVETHMAEEHGLHKLPIRMIKDSMIVLEPDKTFNLYGFGPREVENES